MKNKQMGHFNINWYIEELMESNFLNLCKICIRGTLDGCDRLRIKSSSIRFIIQERLSSCHVTCIYSLSYNENVMTGDEFKSLIWAQKWPILYNCPEVHIFSRERINRGNKVWGTTVFCINICLKTSRDTSCLLFFLVYVKISVLEDFCFFLISSISKP